MPFKSQAQRKYMFAAADRGELPKNMPHEWAHHTKNMSTLPEHVSHTKHAYLRLARDAGMRTALGVVFGKAAAEDATHKPPDDAPAAIPTTPKGPDDSGLPPELANLSPEEQQQLLMLLQAQMGDGGSAADLPPGHPGAGPGDQGDAPDMMPDPRADMPPEHPMHPMHHAAGGPHEAGGPPHEGAPPHHGAPPHGGPTHEGMPHPGMSHPGMSHPGALSHEGAPDEAGLPPDLQALPDMGGDPNADPHMGADDQHHAAPRHTSDEFVSFVQQDGTEDETGNDKPKPTEAGTIPEKPPHWSGNASLEGGDAGTRNYQMGLPRSGAV